MEDISYIWKIILTYNFFKLGYITQDTATDFTISPQGSKIYLLKL